MKVTKPFCIDGELLEDLKKINASELVNSLLKEHFDGVNAMNLSKLKRKLSENLQKKKILLRNTRDLRTKIKEIDTKERKILSLSKKFPEKILKEIGDIKGMLALHVAHKHGNLKNYAWMDVKQVFNELKGGNTKQ